MRVSPRILRPEDSSHHVSEKEMSDWARQADPPQIRSPPNTEATSVKAQTQGGTRAT